MKDKQLFQIGGVAKMFHVSMGTLRHYEQIGLLRPEYTDPDTGYRYYGIRQFEVLNTARYLRVLDMPLSEITEFIQNRDVDVIREKLQKQKELVAAKKKELDLIERKIEHRLEYLETIRTLDQGVIHRVDVPACRMVSVQEQIQPESYLDLEYAIRKIEDKQTESFIFQGKIGIGISKERLEQRNLECYDQVFLLLDEEDFYEGKVETYPKMSGVVIRFSGSHQNAKPHYEMLLDYISEHHLRICGFSRELALIDDSISKDVEQYMTEILIPVEEM